MDRSVGDTPVGSGTRFRSFLLLDHRAPWSRTAAADAVAALLGPEEQQLVAEAEAGPVELRPFAIRPVADRRATQVAPPRLGSVGHGSGMTTLTGPLSAAALRTVHPSSADTGDDGEVLIGVCTNAKRDRCCAVRGRPVATALHAEFGAPISEISHLGGHRFAATMMVLPTGYSYGSVELDAARDIVRDALDGLVNPTHLRGRADLTPPEQAADAFWRSQLGSVPLDAVRITDSRPDDPSADTDVIRVSAAVQGTSAAVRVRYVAGPRVEASVCSTKPFRTGHWVVREA